MGKIVTRNGKKYIVDKDGKTICRYKDSKKRKIGPKDMVSAAAIFSMITLLALNHKHPGMLPDNIKTSDITIDDLEEKIINSSNLSNAEKDYLNNERFFEDILPFINKSLLNRSYLDSRISNMEIKSFGNYNYWYNIANGYYDKLDNPSSLFVKDYEYMNMYNQDTIAHEFVHLCQMVPKREIINEACAEIISSEYYDNCSLNSYTNQVKLVQILMEIIGPESVWEYNFTGDFSGIEAKVRPYLDEKNYRNFLKIRDYNSKTINKDCSDILGALEKLYENKYGNKMSQDKIIAIINNGYIKSRYYFNSDYIKQEKSYYYIKELQVTPTYEAYKKGDIRFYMKLDDIISYDKAIDILKTMEDSNSGIFAFIYGYKDGKLEALSYADLLNHKDNYKFFKVIGNKTVSYETFCRHNMDLDEKSRYQYMCTCGYAKSIEIGGNAYYYKTVKKSLPPVKTHKLIKIKRGENNV